MFKRLINFVVILFLIISINSISIKAENLVSINIDGYDLRYSDTIPENKSGRIFVPLRLITENLYKSYNYNYKNKINLEIKWDSKTNTVSVPGEFTHLVGTSYLTLRDGRQIDTGINSYIKNDRVMVGIRLISEALDCEVNWDNEKNKIIIYTPKYLSEDEWQRYLNALNSSYLSLWEEDDEKKDNDFIKKNSIKYNWKVPFIEKMPITDNVCWTGDPKKDKAIIAFLIWSEFYTIHFSDEILNKYLVGTSLNTILDEYNYRDIDFDDPNQQPSYMYSNIVVKEVDNGYYIYFRYFHKNDSSINPLPGEISITISDDSKFIINSSDIKERDGITDGLGNVIGNLLP